MLDYFPVDERNSLYVKGFPGTLNKYWYINSTICGVTILIILIVVCSNTNNTNNTDNTNNTNTKMTTHHAEVRRCA